MKSLYLIFFSSLVLFSCVKEIQFTGSSTKPRLVLNGILEVDSTLKIYLERSVFFLDNTPISDYTISSGATVTVRNLNTNETFVLSQGINGLYEFPTVVAPNTNYTISVSHPDYDPISSEMRTLSKIDISSIDTSSFMTNYGLRTRYNMKWNDPVNEENYYIVSVMSYSPDGEEGYYEYPLQLNSQDPSVEQFGSTEIEIGGGNQNDPEYLVLSDKSFNGTIKELVFSSVHIGPSQWGGDNSTYVVTLLSMNKETYLYTKSKNNFTNDDFFSEPVKVFSNILNGFGIFGFYNYSYYIFQ